MLGHATFHTYELAIPLFVAVWLDSFGTTPAVLGVVVGLGYAAIGLGALPTGILADRVSARSLVIVCLVGMGASVALLSLAPSLPILAIALLGWGVSASLYHPAGLTLISRATRERGTAFALHGAVGVATGPLLAAVLLGLFDWRFVAAGLALRLEFDERAGARVREDEPVGDGGEGRSLRGFLGQSKLLFTGGFALVFTVGVLYGTYYRGAITFLPDILADLALFEPVAAYGTTVEPSQYVYAGLLLLGGVGQYAGGRLVDAVPVEWALVAGYASLVVIAVAFIRLTAAGLVPLLVGAAVLGFSVFMIAPINQEAISAYTTADVRGLSFGYNYAAIFGIGALGATLAGLLLTRWSPAVLFLILAGIALVGMAVSALLLRPSIGRACGIAD
jgi:MFS family permease